MFEREGEERAGEEKGREQRGKIWQEGIQSPSFLTSRLLGFWEQESVRATSLDSQAAGDSPAPLGLPAGGATQNGRSVER